MSSTPPVVRDSFAYANDSFYAETSNGNRHRRAALAELKALFRPPAAKKSVTPEKEPVGHWYEAQLLHYGLPPSKTKAVAKTRLLDAVNKGNLKVPSHLLKLEDDLKKEWWKNERAAKKGQRPGAKVAPEPRANPGPQNQSRSTVKAPNQSKSTQKSTNVGAPKAPKAPKVPKEPKEPKEKKAPKGPKTPQITQASKTAKSKAVDKPSSNKGKQPAKPRENSPAPPAPVGPVTFRRKQTARKRASNVPPDYSSSPSSVASSEYSADGEPSRPRQFARKTANNVPRDYIPGTSQGKRKRSDESSGARASKSHKTKQEARHAYGSTEEDSIDPNQYHSHHSEADSGDYSEEASGNEYRPGSLPEIQGPLGLINGKYALHSSDLNEWSEYDPDDFSLILCLEGNAIWGAYDFGMYSGIMHFAERPLQSSQHPVSFQWRGRENSEGVIDFRPDNHGWVRFLGNGYIEGMISCYGKAAFWGRRVSGNQTRAPRDAQSMRQEWQGYNQREYDRANRARWGGSGGWY